MQASRRESLQRLLDRPRQCYASPTSLLNLLRNLSNDSNLLQNLPATSLAASAASHQVLPTQEGLSLLIAKSESEVASHQYSMECDAPMTATVHLHAMVGP